MNAPYEEFYSVEVNQTSIPKDCYTTQKGSTRVTLTPNYLATLPQGAYNLRIVFNEGFAATDFTVAPAAPPVATPTPTPAPPTGDNTPWAAALLLLGGAAVVALARRRATKG